MREQLAAWSALYLVLLSGLSQAAAARVGTPHRSNPIHYFILLYFNGPKVRRIQMAGDKKTDDYHISRPPTQSRGQAFLQFLYNPRTHEVLGRTAKSWSKLKSRCSVHGVPAAPHLARRWCNVVGIMQLRQRNMSDKLGIKIYSSDPHFLRHPVCLLGWILCRIDDGLLPDIGCS